MNRNDLRRVDLNMLIVFETLMHERSVTRAAEKLFLGQPAISAALGRLRNLFNDPLFVRGTHGTGAGNLRAVDTRPRFDLQRRKPGNRLQPGYQPGSISPRLVRRC